MQSPGMSAPACLGLGTSGRVAKGKILSNTHCDVNDGLSVLVEAKQWLWRRPNA